MPGENLTREEAQTRVDVVHKVHNYDVTLDLTTGDTTFDCVTRIEFDAEEGASTFLDAITRTVRSVTLNGVSLNVDEVNDGVRISLPNLKAKNTVEVDAEMVYMNTGEGLHRFVDPADNEVYLYSQFEVPDCRRMFPVFEQPDLKATFTFHVTAPKYWEVLSNQPTPEPEPLDDARAVWHFAPTPVMSSYITALVAGPYHAVRSELTNSEGRTIPLGVFCRQSLAEHLDADNIIDTTKRGFEYYEANFDYPYPFEKYDQIFVPEYNMGAMENIGCVTFTEVYVFRSKVSDAVRERRDVTILHELGHMWFGDLVTMKWWNDLWLNESFAEFISTIACAEATEWKEAWTTFGSMEKAWAYRQDQLPSTHPIVAEIRDLDDVQVNFDGITYAKGGSVLKQLFFWVGREPFFKGLNAYFNKHAYSNTVLTDLLTEFEATSGRDLAEWSKLWLETAGVNTLRPRITTDEDGVITEFVIEQTYAEGYETLRPHRLVVGCYDFNDEGVLSRVERVELDVDGAETAVEALVGTKRAPFVLVNDEDFAYAKIRLDEVSLDTLKKHLSALTEPLPRALALAAVWDATRDGEFPASEFVDFVLSNLGDETESSPRMTLINQIRTAVRSYSNRERLSGLSERTGEAFQRLAEEADAGSDAQLMFARAAADFATTPQQLDWVEALLSGSTKLEGLTIDQDLAWDLVIALAAGGRIEEEEIERRRVEDNSPTGDKQAAHALAVRPTAEAKEAAWQRAVERDDAPNAIVRSTAAGFVATREKALLEPYVSRYFDALERVWDTRSYHMAEEIIGGFYPPVISDRAVEAATVWLDGHPDASAALRRMVLEGRDDIQRALRAQAADA